MKCPDCHKEMMVVRQEELGQVWFCDSCEKEWDVYNR